MGLGFPSATAAAAVVAGKAVAPPHVPSAPSKKCQSAVELFALLAPPPSIPSMLPSIAFFSPIPFSIAHHQIRTNAFSPLSPPKTPFKKKTAPKVTPQFRRVLSRRSVVGFGCGAIPPPPPPPPLGAPLPLLAHLPIQFSAILGHNQPTTNHPNKSGQHQPIDSLASPFSGCRKRLPNQFNLTFLFNSPITPLNSIQHL
jgi:hypothetical protein